MTGTTITSAEVDARRRRLLFRAWHRGMREMDLLLGSYIDAHIVAWSDDEVSAFEHLMDVQDQTLLGWFVGREPVPANYDTPLWRDMVRFHSGRAIAEGLYDL